MKLEREIRKLFNLRETRQYGIDESQIAEAEKKLGLRFPRALRSYYGTFANAKKTNINHELFRVQDVYIEDGRYLVFGKDYNFDIYYAINTADVENENPAVHETFIKRDMDTLEAIIHGWRGVQTAGEFILEKILESALDGGLKYRIHYWNDQEAVMDGLPVIEQTAMSRIEALRGSFEQYYTGDYNYIVKIYRDIRRRGEIISFYFGTEHRDMYEKTAAALNRKGITVERESNTLSREYRVYTKDIPQPRLEFVPGEYVSGRNRNRERSIYLPEDAVLTFIDLLREVNKDFDYYGITTEYNREQTAVLINGLAERLNTMTNDKKFVFIKGNGAMDYYKKSNVDYRRYKRQIQKMYMDLIQWLKEMKEDKLNILGV